MVSQIDEDDKQINVYMYLVIYRNDEGTVYCYLGRKDLHVSCVPTHVWEQFIFRLKNILLRKKVEMKHRRKHFLT